MGRIVFVVVAMNIALNIRLLESAAINGTPGSAVEDEHLPSTIKGLSYRVSTVSKACTLFATGDEVTGEIKDHLSSGVNLLKFYVEFPSTANTFPQNSTSPIYKPLYWVRTPGRLGNGLLLLRPEYDVLSLMTLELRVVTMHIKTAMSPPNCLGDLNVQDSEKVLRALVMSDFLNSSSDDIDAHRTEDRICNIHATNASGVVRFRYLCCHNSDPNYIYCEYLESDTWLNLLFALLTFIKILVVLFSPRFVPDSLYRLKHQPTPYRHKCPEGSKVILHAIVTSRPEKIPTEKVRNKFRPSDFEGMPEFWSCFDSMEPDTPYRLTLDQIRISVGKERLLSAKQAPVGIVKTLYDSFVKCQISERDALAECCQADALPNSCCKRKKSFVNLCRKLMQLFLLLLLTVPWILRLIAYYQLEHDEITMRKEAASQQGLEFYFPGNLILLFTPVHGIFLAAYIILSFELCLFGVFGRFSTKASEHLKFVIRKCFRDMREMNHTKVVGWAVKLLLRPCTTFGLTGILIGFLLWPFIIPIIILIWAFYMFPTVNITLRLIYNLLVYIAPCRRPPRCYRKLRQYLNLKHIDFPDSSSDQAKTMEMEILMSCVNRIYQVFIILTCLFTMYSIILLIFEFVSFLAEIVVYTMMGMILNAGTILTYLSLLLLVGVYGQDCFGNVTNTFMAFNKKMNEIVVGMACDKVKGVVYTKEDKQDNVSFRVKTEQCSELESPVQLSKGTDGKPRWNVARLLLFLNKSDEPSIPNSFYFKACKMDYYAVPGDVLVLYLRAARDFGVIMLFLAFVLLVVVAFGGSFEISTTNKLLVTVLGGFVPLLLRKFVFKSYSVASIAGGSIHFQVSLTDLIDPYEEAWPVFDIEVHPGNIDVAEDFNGKFDLLIDTSG